MAGGGVFFFFFFITLESISLTYEPASKQAAVYLGSALGKRVLYTTPLKALSNQKYNDFCAQFGAERVRPTPNLLANTAHIRVQGQSSERV